MIKNLRSIFVVALMAVSGSMFAQGTTESKGEVINFVNFYKPLTEVKEVEAGKDKTFYIATKAIEQNGIKVTFDKVNGSGAPTYTIAWDKNKNEYVAHNFIRLYGGDVKRLFLRVIQWFSSQIKISQRLALLLQTQITGQPLRLIVVKSK